MSEDRFVWSSITGSNGRQKTGMKPSTMLVAPFEVEVCRGFKDRILFYYCGM